MIAAISLKLRPQTLARISREADARNLTLSELAREYIEAGLAGAGE